MDDLKPMRKAADAAGVTRQTIARWVKSGKLKGKKAKVGHLTATFVSVSVVRKLKADQPRGRPRKQ